MANYINKQDKMT